MSESEEMYLLTIVSLQEQGLESPVPLSRLADELSVQSVSVNQMVRKLAKARLVDYVPYKGVALTPEGEQQARYVLRHRRLWEAFLVQRLHLPLDDADALACKMEHITPREVAERLSAFLGHPTVSPQGRPIPRAADGAFELSAQPLSALAVGQAGQITHVDAESAAGEFLLAEGVRPGAEIAVLGAGGRGTVLVQVNGHQMTLASTLAEKIFIEKQ